MSYVLFDNFTLFITTMRTPHLIWHFTIFNLFHRITNILHSVFIVLLTHNCSHCFSYFTDPVSWTISLTGSLVRIMITVVCLIQVTVTLSLAAYLVWSGWQRQHLEPAATLIPAYVGNINDCKDATVEPVGSTWPSSRRYWYHRNNIVMLMCCLGFLLYSIKFFYLAERPRWQLRGTEEINGRALYRHM